MLKLALLAIIVVVLFGVVFGMFLNNPDAMKAAKDAAKSSVRGAQGNGGSQPVSAPVETGKSVVPDNMK